MLEILSESNLYVLKKKVQNASAIAPYGTAYGLHPTVLSWMRRSIFLIHIKFICKLPFRINLPGSDY